jgi:hypothetical protein
LPTDKLVKSKMGRVTRRSGRSSTVTKRAAVSPSRLRPALGLRPSGRRTWRSNSLHASPEDKSCGVRLVLAYREDPDILWCMPHRPYVTLAFAQSIDGRIATITGESQWISGEETLSLSQEIRAASDAILVGVGTVIRDDPRLTCRLPGSPSPLRVILDGRLRVPLSSTILRTASEYPTVVFTGRRPATLGRIDRQQRSRCEVAGPRFVQSLPAADPTSISAPCWTTSLPAECSRSWSRVGPP